MHRPCANFRSYWSFGRANQPSDSAVPSSLLANHRRSTIADIIAVITPADLAITDMVTILVSQRSARPRGPPSSAPMVMGAITYTHTIMALLTHTPMALPIPILDIPTLTPASDMATDIRFTAATVIAIGARPSVGQEWAIVAAGAAASGAALAEAASPAACMEAIIITRSK